MPELTGAEILVEELANQGVRYIFGLPGNEIIEVLDAALRRGGPQFILTHGEEAAAFMALGYARSSKKPAACLAAEGPGACSLASGVSAAFKTNNPVIVITGKHKRAQLEKDTNHELDAVPLYAAITKWSYLVSNVEKMPDVVRKAFRVALSGAPGPVHLSIPEDVLTGKTAYEPIPPEHTRAQSRPECSPALVAEVLSRVVSARSPVLLAGREILRENAQALLVPFVEALGIPVVTSAEHMDAMPSVHPLCLGPMGLGGGWESANAVVRDADVLLALGVKFDYRTTRLNHDFIPKKTAILHVSRHPEVIGAVLPVAMDVVGSVSSFLEQGLKLLEQEKRRPPARTDLGDLKRAWDEKRAAKADPVAKPIKAQYVARLLRQLMPSDGIIVVDSGNFSKHIRQNFSTFGPDTYYYTENYGSTGSGIPLALGTKLARPEREVVCAAGDCGFLMRTTELETAVRVGARFTAVVFNDGGLGNTREQQLRSYGRVTGSSYGPVDVAGLASSLGAEGFTVHDPGELEATLRRALTCDVPAVVNVHVDPGDLLSSV